MEQSPFGFIFSVPAGFCVSKKIFPFRQGSLVSAKQKCYHAVKEKEEGKERKRDRGREREINKEKEKKSEQSQSETKTEGRRPSNGQALTA